MEHLTYLFWAYMIIWVVIGLYLLNIGTRLKKAEKRFDLDKDEA